MASDTQQMPRGATPAAPGQKIEPPMPPEAAEPPRADIDADADAEQSPADALRGLGHSFAELKDYAGYYVAAKLDGLKLTVRNLTLYAALGVMGAVIGAAVLVCAVVLALTGLAGLLNALINIGGHAARAGLVPALGNFIVGLLLLGGLAFGTWWAINRLFKSSRKQTIEKYENRRRQQTLDHGTNVHDRATAQQ